MTGVSYTFEFLLATTLVGSDNVGLTVCDVKLGLTLSKDEDRTMHPDIYGPLTKSGSRYSLDIYSI